MSIECYDCEHDLRGNHGPGCAVGLKKADFIAGALIKEIAFIDIDSFVIGQITAGDIQELVIQYQGLRN